jgi:CRP/FNR family transcriptional regulator, cyclic AMP receptor protein
MESQFQQSCLECLDRADRHFCDLATESLKAFDRMKSIALHPRGTVLFRQGHPAREIVILCGGRAKLSVCSESGKKMTLRIAGPGEVLGLSASLAGSLHQMTAELLDNAQIATVKRTDLLRFLREQPEACLQVVNLLSQDLHTAYDRVRSVGLGRGRRSRVSRVQ